MSHFSATHDFVSWKSGDSALSGQRLSRIFYKSAQIAEGKKNAAVSIPPLELSCLVPDVVDQLKPHMLQFLLDTQDSIIRAAYEAGAKTVNDSEITVAACFAWLDEASESNRLTSEKVKEWFCSSLQDALTVAFADKLGVAEVPTPEQEKKIAQALNVYRDKFASLSSGRAGFTVPVCDSLLSALSHASQEDSIAARFQKRLEKMKAENSQQLEDLL